MYISTRLCGKESKYAGVMKVGDMEKELGKESNLVPLYTVPIFSINLKVPIFSINLTVY